MSTPASALSKHYLAFSIVFIVVLVLLSVYCVLAPETEKFNVTPFPMVSPADLPDNQIQGTTCYDTLTRCDDAGQCSRCSSDFTCTYVSQNSNYVFNGTKVSPGDWCLPAASPNQTCNLYTGQWLWTSDASGQSWKCDCLYPDLYSGPDCGTQVACINQFVDGFREGNDGKQDQSVNKLVATKEIPFTGNNIPAGTPWDPYADPYGDPNMQNALQLNPLSKNDDGSPMFRCKCQNTVSGFAEIPTISLPNDPYHCHMDPCLSQVYSDGGGFYENSVCLAGNCAIGVASASCNCIGIGYGNPIPSGPGTGLCQDEDYSCKLTYDNQAFFNGSFETAKNSCNCIDGATNKQFGTARDCSVGEPMEAGKNQCILSTNLFGKECYSECADITYRNPKDNQPACAQCHDIKDVCSFLQTDNPTGNYICGDITGKTNDFIGCCGATGPVVDDAIGMARVTTLGGKSHNCTKMFWPENSVVAFQPVKCSCNADTDNIQIAPGILDMSKLSCSGPAGAQQCQFYQNQEFANEMENNLGVSWTQMDSHNEGGKMIVGDGKRSGVDTTVDNNPCGRNLLLTHANHGYIIPGHGDAYDSRWGIVCASDPDPSKLDQSVKDNIGDDSDEHLTGLNVNARDASFPNDWVCWPYCE